MVIIGGVGQPARRVRRSASVIARGGASLNSWWRTGRDPTEIIFVGFPQRHAVDFVSPYAVIVTLDKTE